MSSVIKFAENSCIHWFYKSTLHIKRSKNGLIYWIFHPVDIEKFLGVDNLNEYINNVSF